MTEKLGSGAWNREKLAEMTTEELSALLRTDLEAPAGQEADPEMLLCVMEELACRRKPEENEKTPQEAWIAFQRDYLPDVEAAKTPEPSKKCGRLWLRRAVAVAAVVAVLVSIPLICLAIDWEACFDGLATWTKEIFFFNRSGETETTQHTVEAGDYDSLQQVLEAAGRECDFLPTWIPDGYELQEIVVDQTPVSSAYIGIYCFEEKYMDICVFYDKGNSPAISEKGGDAVEIYETEETRFYIFNNEDQVCVAWSWGAFDCYVSGDLSVEEVKMMIASIGKEQTDVE